MLRDTVARLDPRLSGMLVAGLRTFRALLAHCQSRRALRAAERDWAAGSEKLPRFTLSTRIRPVATSFGVLPSRIRTYFPNGRPPLLALPRLVLRRYEAAFFAF